MQVEPIAPLAPPEPGQPVEVCGEIESLEAATPGTGGFVGDLVFSWDAASQTAHSRVFVPGLGVPEDPATGSAALGLGVWLVASGLLPGDGTAGYTVRQGIEISRPSSLACTVTAANGAAVGATVAGQVVPVARGEIMVPPFVG